MGFIRSYAKHGPADFTADSPIGCTVAITDLNDDVVRGRLFTGSFPACVEWVKTHSKGRDKVPLARGQSFSIIYTASGRVAPWIMPKRAASRKPSQRAVYLASISPLERMFVFDSTKPRA
jgi:hypothetical protein